MKQILKYMLFAGVAMMAASCEREPLAGIGGEGAVNFSIDYSAATRAVNESDFTPDPVKVRIYRPEGDTDSALIRRYTALDEIPEPLYLVSGNYSIKVEAGDKENVAFVEDDAAARKLKLCYEGWKSFTVDAHQTNDISVSCPTINVRANLLFDTSDSKLDDTGRRIYENRKFSDVKITVAAVTTDATTLADYTSAVAAAEAPKLVFDAFETVGTASGYFLLPEGVETLVWAFEGQHETDGQIARIGMIKDVKPAHAYKVSFFYTRTPDGYAKVEVEVDDEVEVLEDDWYFKPQPEISGSGIDAAAVNNYTEGSDVVLVCESINDLVTLSLGGTEFFKQGAVVPDAINGVSCVKNEATKVTITLSEAYFDTLNGGVQALSFGMQDAGSAEVYAQRIEFFKQGLVAEEATADLWANTATFKALVQESVGTVTIRYRKAGGTDWNTLTAIAGATADGYTTYTATSTAGWIESTNSNNHKVYTPDLNKSIFADNRYEYQLLLDGAEEGPVAIYAPTTTQTIVDSSFENGGMTCFSTSSANTTFWGSGNNSITTSLCRQSTFVGQSGSYCAKMTANDPGMLSMMAAGNLFTGQFNMNGFKGTVSFGVDYNWEARPTALKLKYWAKVGSVTHTTYNSDNPNGGLAKGAQDQASIYVSIIDWDTQHGVTSGSGTPSGVWSPENGADAVSAGKVIGYGIVYPNKTTDGSSMVELEIPINYYDTVTKPSKRYKLIIACATSRYGDYMNGCASNEMYVDDFQWIYHTDYTHLYQ